jgi:hypothetical protein
MLANNINIISIFIICRIIIILRAKDVGYAWILLLTGAFSIVAITGTCYFIIINSTSFLLFRFTRERWKFWALVEFFVRLCNCTEWMRSEDDHLGLFWEFFRFCFGCIDNWATITNLCPLCQNEFQSITCVPVSDLRFCKHYPPLSFYSKFCCFSNDLRALVEVHIHLLFLMNLVALLGYLVLEVFLKLSISKLCAIWCVTVSVC